MYDISIYFVGKSAKIENQIRYSFDVFWQNLKEIAKHSHNNALTLSLHALGLSALSQTKHDLPSVSFTQVSWIRWSTWAIQPRKVSPPSEMEMEMEMKINSF